MPRNVRNFWITGKADGLEKAVAFGPRSADGGFSLTIHQRDKGNVTTPLYITGEWVDGTLQLKASGPVGLILNHKTER